MKSSEKFLSDIEKFIANQDELTSNDKQRISNAVINCLSINYKLQNIYIPTAARINIAIRNAAILSDFTGHNHNELARKYAVSMQTIYKVIQRNRTGDRCKRNAPFFITVMDEYIPSAIANAGIEKNTAKTLAKKIAGFIFDNYSGITFHF